MICILVIFDPTLYTFDRANTFIQARKNVDTLISKYGDNTIPLIFDNYQTALNIINLIVPGNYPPSLELNICKSGNKVYGFLDNTSLYVPGKNCGTWLLRLAISLSQSLGLPYIKLIDRAKIIDQGYNHKLLFIRIFQGKLSSWYQKFGFVLKLGKSKYLQENLLTDMNFLYSTNLDINGQMITHLGSYMIQLWKSDKTEYGKILNTIASHPVTKQSYNNIKKAYSQEFILTL